MFIEEIYLWMKDSTDTRVRDVYLYGPCCYHESNQIYSLPNIAPEVLGGENCTTVLIYSFNIIMNILQSENDLRAHNISLASKRYLYG
ncbi:hypothetical protein RclHR1_05120006 [Rhizophagus clarus]|uniref:Uncharacterized protein n=1 Tax=Rhizophagus clarus TaxID=94130 RepID=A0A2Z6RKZ0_9GLOM|nr:hypothetical protein RclHR1_05120006 [Rhizophagus clarus]